MDDDLAWETNSAHTAYTCPGFDIRHEEVTLPDGTESDYDYLTEPGAVVVLPFTDEGEVVVIEEWRQTVKRVNRGLPAGTVEPHDDDLAAAAHRELTEETGYVADRVEPLVTVEPANGIADSVHHHFVAYGCQPADEQALDFNEFIHVETTTLDALLADARAGRLRDGRAVTNLCYYALFESE